MPASNFLSIVRVFLRTWPYLKPLVWHIVLWVCLQLASFTTSGLAVVLVQDILNNKIMLGHPLEPGQATLLLLDERYVETAELTQEQRIVVRDRFILAVALGVLLNTLVLQLIVLHYYFTWITQQLNQRLRVAMIERAERVSLRYHSHARTGDAIYRIYQDSNTITAVVDTVILDPINITARCLTALFILWLFSPWLGLIGVLATVPILAIAAWYTPRLQRLSRQARQAASDLTSRIQEAFAGIRVVKANQAEQALLARFDADSRRALDAALRLRLEIILLWMAILAVGGGGILLADYLMAGWTMSEENTWLAGMVTLVGFAVWNLGAYQAASGRSAEYSDWSRGLIAKWTHMLDMAVGLERAFRLLDGEVDVEESANPVAVPKPIHEVAFREVSFSYQPGTPVLTGVDLVAKAGTVTALVGATGAGKTTLMSLLLRLYDPDSGTISLNGTDLRDMGIEDLRGNIAIALQQNVLFAATVADNIGYAASVRGAAATRDEIEAAAHIACADEFIGSMAQGYDTELGERGGKLSAGQRQRLSIARAVLRDTPILILDEPTASLDAQTEQRLLRNLSEWGIGRVVFLITHRLSTIQGADRIAFLEHGRFVETGDHETLVAMPDGRYRSFVEAEVAGAREAS